MDAVESLLKIHIVDIQLPLPYNALFNDVVDSEDLVHASLSFLKTCLLLAKSLVHCFRDLPEGELSWELAGYSPRGDSSPVVQGSFLQNLQDDTFRLVIR